MRTAVFTVLACLFAALMLTGCAANARENLVEYAPSHSAQAPIESTANLPDELWIIPRSHTGITKTGSGMLGGVNTDSGTATIASATLKVVPAAQHPLPLAGSSLAVTIDTFLATCVLTQQFANPNERPVDIEYSFALPERTFVTDFQLDIGDRHIRGVVVEQSEAIKLYAAALKQGLRATLLTQSTGNVFTVHVADVAPGKPIETHLTLLRILAWESGKFVWQFPNLGINSATVDLAADGVLGEITAGTRPLRQSRTQHSAHFEFGGEHAAAARDYALNFEFALPAKHYVLALKEKAPSGRVCVALLLFPASKVPSEAWAAHIVGEVNAVYPAANVPWPTDGPAMMLLYPRQDAQSVSIVNKVYAEEFVLDQIPSTTPHTLSVLYAAGRIGQLRAAGKLDEALKLALESALITPQTAFITIDATREKHDK